METPGESFAATWRDADDRVVSTTYGGTLCWYPNLPWRIRLVRPGMELIARCRECPGCLELERRRLAGRLHVKYGSGGREGSIPSPSGTPEKTDRRRAPASALFLIRIWAPRERHAAICHRLHRRHGIELEPGMYRLGTGSFAVLGRSRVTPPLRAALEGLEYRVEPIHLRRGRRAWRALTAGILVTREAYGEQVKRWYVRGLPPAERESWDVVKLSAYKPYNRFRSPRAWTSGNLVLVPPEIWAASRVQRQAFRRLAAHATSPEGASAIAAEVLALAGTIGVNLSLPGPAQPALSHDAVQRWYRERVARDSARTSVLSQSGSSPLPSEGGGYASSGHSSNSPPGEIWAGVPPEQLELSGVPRWQEIEALKRRPWDELTTQEREELRSWEREQDARRETRADRIAKDRAAIAEWLARMKARL